MNIPAKILLSCLVTIGFEMKINAQNIANDTIKRVATISYDLQGRSVSFNPNTPALHQVAGAPPAFYTYYWEFGDGSYSFEEKPQHTYKTPGEYSARLSVTNNYDDGKPPTTRPKRLTIADNIATDDVADASTENNSLLEQHNGFRLQNNREPLVNEEMEFIISYGNKKQNTTNGKLYLFFNEKKYKAKNFELLDVRTYHDEKEVSDKMMAQHTISKNTLIQSTGIATFVNTKNIVLDSVGHDLPLSLEDANAYYQDSKVWEFNNLEPNEQRNLFLTFKTTPEMLKDTTAVITIRSIFVPERGNQEHQVLNKEMEIVTSHDPNKMAVYNSFLNYRLVRFKRLKYKVRFQNNGEGPARLIKLNVDIPDMLDKSSLELIDMYPKVPICPDGQKTNKSCIDTVFTKNQISFQFKNIYLPGTAQKGVKDKDSTKGFVKYSLKFGKNFHKKRSTSKTEIIFDKNDPIITNTSTSRFVPGISIGAKTGYNSFPKLDNSKNYFIGATISPYKSYKKYWQAELMFAKHTYNTTTTNSTYLGDYDTVNGIVYTNTSVNTTEKQAVSKINLDIVPISFRYNLNNIFGLGVGVHSSVSINTDIDADILTTGFGDFNGTIAAPIAQLTSRDTKQYTQGLSLNNYGVFGDITAGASRIGPSVGARYMVNFKTPNSQIHLYAIWKF